MNSDNTLLKELTRDFIYNYFSTKDLSLKYNLKKNFIRSCLKNKLGDFYYKQSRIISGKKFSTNIKRKMQNDSYREKWLNNVRKASKLGHEKVRSLLKNDEIFRQRWINNCKKGGQKSYKTHKGFHDPKNRYKRLLGSIKGLKNTGKKILGPRGENMYNLHEIRVAKEILNIFPSYIYEKRFYVQNDNGYISCDFFLQRDRPIVIEATLWDNVLEKCKRFQKKYSHLNKIFSDGFDFLIVVGNENMKREYSYYLPKLNVVSVQKLNKILLEIKYRG